MLAGPASAKCGDRAVADPDLIALLPPPPAPDSEADRADRAALLAIQKARTPEAAARAQRDRPVDAFVFADLLGAGFSRENLPVTARLLDRMDDYLKGPVQAAKAFWCRPRPFMRNEDKAVEPLFTSRGTSYPSGHNAFGRFAAIVLGELFPHRRAELFARGDEYGDGRVVAGVHYPADAAAGRVAGTLIAQRALRDPSFVYGLERAKDEIERVMAAK